MCGAPYSSFFHSAAESGRGEGPTWLDNCKSHISAEANLRAFRPRSPAAFCSSHKASAPKEGPLLFTMMDDDDLQRIYQWVDEIPLSRPKRNIARDFADGVLVAEICAHYFPRLIEVHNYPAANSYAQKTYNWTTLNAKVFKKMGFQLNKEEMDALCNCTPQAVERMLKKLQQNMAKYGARKSAGEDTEAHPTGAAKPYKPPPKPAPRAPTVARGPTSRARGGAAAADGARGGGEPSMARLEDMALHDEAVQKLLAEKDAQMGELRETVDILEVKIQKLEQLVRLKDSKIATLQAKLQQPVT